jgi:hypothetical protein
VPSPKKRVWAFRRRSLVLAKPEIGGPVGFHAKSQLNGIYIFLAGWVSSLNHGCLVAFLGADDGSRRRQVEARSSCANNKPMVCGKRCLSWLYALNVATAPELSCAPASDSVGHRFGHRGHSLSCCDVLRSQWADWQAVSRTVAEPP